jgi:hypothetical protein
LFANHFFFLGIGIYGAVIVEAAPVMHYLHVAQWDVRAALGVQVLAYGSVQPPYFNLTT